MSKILQLLLSYQAYQRLKNKYHHYRQDNASGFTAFCMLCCTLSGWIFLKLESSTWQLVRQNSSYWFPHISQKKPRPGDIFRYLFQCIWLILILPERKGIYFNITNFFQKGLHFYYSGIEKIPEKLKLNKTVLKTAKRFGQISAISRRLLFIILGIFSAILLVICITQPFKPTAQLIFVVLLWFMAMSIRKVPGAGSTIMLVVLSVIVSCRYLWWRYAYTLMWDNAISILFGVLLIFAETYIWLVMILGYFQSIWPLHRQPVPLPEDRSLWPTVDVLLATYNEELSIVKPGVYSALGLDWPKDKITIYILDDGNRPEFKAFAEEVGVQYIARPTHEHAKAGNINYALKHSKSDLVVVFDCDYVIANPFLKLTAGWFIKDPNLAILQTPHHFFSPDPFERNFESFRKTPNESALFYGVIQDGNDTWNATYFCGSSGIMRRSALERIGGLAVESVTEDAHTSLRLQRLGYDSAYIRIPLAAGMAAESLAGHIGQRIRWARGMIQIFRMDNPLFGKGLKLSQRLCYFSAMLHFLSGVPRLIFFVAPSAFLLFNASIVYATGWMLLLYLTPHIVHAVLANDRIQGKYRRFLWNEIYESVMAWYIAIPTTIALINPHKGTFNVTAKGDLIKERYVNWGIARPYVVLLIINFIGLISACLHLIIGPLTLNPYGDVLPYFITMVWLFYNMIILGGALGVSIETRQVRKAHRVTFTMPAVLRRQNGQEISCTIRDYSYTGLGMDLDEPEVFQNEEAVDLLIKHNERDYAFPCTVAYIRNQKMGVYLNALSLQENIDFIQCTFARSEVWVLWQGGFEQDKPLQSMKEVFTLDLRGYWDIIEFTSPAVRKFLIGFARVIIWIGSFIPRRPKYCLING